MHQYEISPTPRLIIPRPAVEIAIAVGSDVTFTPVIGVNAVVTVHDPGVVGDVIGIGGAVAEEEIKAFSSLLKSKS